jgi:hypothetical protein
MAKKKFSSKPLGGLGPMLGICVNETSRSPATHEGWAYLDVPHLPEVLGYDINKMRMNARLHDFFIYHYRQERVVQNPVRHPSASGAIDSESDNWNATLDRSAVAFRDAEGLATELTTAIELARKHFNVLGTPTVTMKQDPEFESSYLVIEIRARGDVASIVNAHRSYAREWTSRVRWPKSEKIRLIYDIV